MTLICLVFTNPSFYSNFLGPSPTGTQNRLGDLKMMSMSKDPTHLYQQLSFSEFVSIHASKSISKVC